MSAAKYDEIRFARRRSDPDAPWNQEHRPKSKKNTVKWCKGIIDREHNIVEGVCLNCGKKFLDTDGRL